ncbi:MAG: dephospho-CoA kinase [Deltaproteobacteria bacterium]|nr:dephospho-CoA kinase [Deltaproteobacteria bacterium]
MFCFLTLIHIVFINANIFRDLMKRTAKIKKEISDTIKGIRKRSYALLLGLTGGVATGKSTVADMFRDLGAVIIDFDMLARDVVKPGRRSWELITGFFGNDILNPDKTINRKRLSGIVFNDPVKREKLESFTHPYIWDEFIMRFEESARLKSRSIILAVIPLLIEGNMQDLFIKNILVYSSPGTQVKRLMDRDQINREMANNILASQMPIDQKIRYADFIIKNEGSIDDTAKEVNELWKRLKLLQGKS